MENRKWYLDKKLSVSIIIAIILEILSITWWGATLDAKISLHGEQLKKNEEFIEKVLRIEERLAALHEEVNELETKLVYSIK